MKYKSSGIASGPHSKKHTGALCPLYLSLPSRGHFTAAGYHFVGWFLKNREQNCVLLDFSFPYALEASVLMWKGNECIEICSLSAKDEGNEGVSCRLLLQQGLHPRGLVPQRPREGRPLAGRWCGLLDKRAPHRHDAPEGKFGLSGSVTCLQNWVSSLVFRQVAVLVGKRGA